MINIANLPDKWTIITYHPQPIVTWVKNELEIKSWEEQIPGCKIESVIEDYGFMKYLTSGIKVKIIYPEEHIESYAEPLATIHTMFWNKFDSLIWDIYPFKSRNIPKFKLGSKVHGIVARIYWKLDYKAYTPSQWVDNLNEIFVFVEKNILKGNSDLDKFESDLINGLSNCKIRS